MHPQDLGPLALGSSVHLDEPGVVFGRLTVALDMQPDQLLANRLRQGKVPFKTTTPNR
jgi:hypothetical protein